MKVREGGFLISKIKQISGRIFDRKLKECGIMDLNSAQGRIIFALWQGGEMPIVELAKKTALGKTTLTGMLERLEQAEYIVRRPDPGDRRSVCVAPAQKSAALQDSYNKVSAEMLALFYRGLSDAEIDVFEKTLNHVLNNLTGYEEEH